MYRSSIILEELLLPSQHRLAPIISSRVREAAVVTMHSKSLFTSSKSSRLYIPFSIRDIASMASRILFSIRDRSVNPYSSCRPSIIGVVEYMPCFTYSISDSNFSRRGFTSDIFFRRDASSWYSLSPCSFESLRRMSAVSTSPIFRAMSFSVHASEIRDQRVHISFTGVCKFQE